MSEPTAVDWKIFLDTFETLAQYEANQRYIRGYGAFSKEDMDKWPLQEVITCMDWIKKQIADCNI